MKVISREPTALAYDGRVPGDPDPRSGHHNPITGAGIPHYVKDGWRLVIVPGLNIVNPDDFKILDQDANFIRHVHDGVMVVQEDDAPVEAVEPSPEHVAFVKEWEQMSPADQAIMYSGLSDEQKALVPVPTPAATPVPVASVGTATANVNPPANKENPGAEPAMAPGGGNAPAQASTK
jgi:hypothetical protein